MTRYVRYFNSVIVYITKGEKLRMLGHNLREIWEFILWNNISALNKINWFLSKWIVFPYTYIWNCLTCRAGNTWRIIRNIDFKIVPNICVASHPLASFMYHSQWEISNMQNVILAVNFDVYEYICDYTMYNCRVPSSQCQKPVVCHEAANYIQGEAPHVI